MEDLEKKLEEVKQTEKLKVGFLLKIPVIQYKFILISEQDFQKILSYRRDIHENWPDMSSTRTC